MGIAVARHSFEPDYGVAPGETLRETLEYQGMSQADFAKRSDLSAKHVNQIVQGEAPITPDTAVAIEMVTGVSARYWMLLEANYQAQSRRLSNPRLLDAADVAWLAAVPVSELIDRRRLEPAQDRSVLFSNVLRFFGVANRHAWEALWSDPDASFHRSAAFQAKPVVTATWLRLAELEAATVDCGPFDRPAFRDAVGVVRAWIAEPITRGLVGRITTTLAAVGVALVFVPEIPGLRAWGATRWVSPSKAYVALSGRYKRDDYFWFTFFHEVAHVLLHGKRQTFVDQERTRKAAGPESGMEVEADRFAADTLIPRARSANLEALTTRAEVEAFAEELSIPAGVVVGRMQREGYVPWSRWNELRLPVDPAVFAPAMSEDPRT